MESKAAFLDGARRLSALGVRFFATAGTAEFMARHGLDTQVVRWPLEGGSPNVQELLKERRVDLVINIPKHFQREELTNDYIIRRTAVDFGIPLLTNLQLAQRLTEALSRIPVEELKVRSWRHYGSNKH